MPPFAARLIGFPRDAAWLDRDRIVSWAGILAGLQAALLLFLALWQHGAFGPVPPTSGDFVSFHAAGKLALAGTPALAYDQAAHALAEQAARGPAPYQFFFYPPVYLMLCLVLATMPYYVGFALFQGLSLGAMLLVVRAVLRAAGFGWLAPVLAFPAVFWTIGLGQNAFLTAALFGGFTLLLGRRPVAAGLLLGLLCYKPHFGLLAPIALLAARQWRAFAAAGATVLALVALSAALFGVETWRAYLTAFAGSDAVYTTGRIDFAGTVTVFGAMRLIGAGTGLATIAQALSTVAMAGLVGWAWSFPLREAGNAAMGGGLWSDRYHSSSSPGLSRGPAAAPAVVLVPGTSPGMTKKDNPGDDETGTTSAARLYLLPSRGGGALHPEPIVILLAATLLAVPMALVYDQLLALIALAWLARGTGFPPWEKITLAAIYPVMLVTWIVGTAWHLPLGPVPPILLLALALRRFLRRRRSS